MRAQGHRALLQIDWEIVVHCGGETRLKDYVTHTFYGETG